jgi:hypothetical protein
MSCITAHMKEHNIFADVIAGIISEFPSGEPHANATDQRLE